jgi:hypothetical protein
MLNCWSGLGISDNEVEGWELEEDDVGLQTSAALEINMGRWQLLRGSLLGQLAHSGHIQHSCSNIQYLSFVMHAI